MDFSNFWNFIAAIEDSYDVHRKRIMSRFGLTSAEVDVLIFLMNNPSLDQASDIVKARKMAKSHVSLAVNHLTELGLITKHKNSENQKNIHLSLTDKTSEFREYATKEQEKFYDLVLQGVTKKEKDNYYSLVTKMIKNIDKEYNL